MRLKISREEDTGVILSSVAPKVTSVNLALTRHGGFADATAEMNASYLLRRSKAVTANRVDVFKKKLRQNMGRSIRDFMASGTT